MRNDLTGRWGEETAAAYLRRRHYTIVAANYRCRLGEIDLIAENRDYLVFVEANEAVDAEVRLYSNLFTDPDPDAADKDFLECLNPDSLEILTGCKIERSLAAAKAPESYQFMRLGYFCPDNKDSTPEHPVFNRSVSLKDSYKPQA